MTTPVPGIRHKIYLAGSALACSLQDYQEEEAPLQADGILADGGLHTDYGLTFDGAPAIITKKTFTLVLRPRPKIGNTDLQLMQELWSMTDGFDFCPWRMEAESFWIQDGETAAGYLQRRHALDVINSDYWPANAATKLAVFSKENGSAGNIALGAIDGTYYRQAWSGGTADAWNTIWYCPVYRVRRVGPRSIKPTKHNEAWTMVLKEEF